MKDDDEKQVVIEIKKACKIFSEGYYDKRKFDDDVETNVWCEKNGYERIEKHNRVKSFYNINIVGYLVAQSFLLAAENINLLRQIQYNGNGFYLRSDNFVEKLPLFCAKLYPQTKWFEQDVYFTTSDGELEYTKDAEFLKACLIFTCLSHSNHCRSFLGSDGRWYYNELCLLQETLSDKALENFTLNEDDKAIIDKWKLVLDEAKSVKPNLQKWGLYQIEMEILEKKKNTKKQTSQTTYSGEHNENLYFGTTQQEIIIATNIIKADCGNLNSLTGELKEALKQYYVKNIQQKLFTYQLLK